MDCSVAVAIEATLFRDACAEVQIVLGCLQRLARDAPAPLKNPALFPYGRLFGSVPIPDESEVVMEMGLESPVLEGERSEDPSPQYVLPGE
eukprot:4638762-Amphidinium_carterae.1